MCFQDRALGLRPSHTLASSTISFYSNYCIMISRFIIFLILCKFNAVPDGLSEQGLDGSGTFRGGLAMPFGQYTSARLPVSRINFEQTWNCFRSPRSLATKPCLSSPLESDLPVPKYGALYVQQQIAGFCPRAARRELIIGLMLLIRQKHVAMIWRARKYACDAGAAHTLFA